MDKKHQIKAAKANPRDIELRDNVGVSRRDFVKAGAAVGVGAAILPAPSVAQAQESPQAIEWNYTADVRCVGSRCHRTGRRHPHQGRRALGDRARTELRRWRQDVTLGRHGLAGRRRPGADEGRCW